MNRLKVWLADNCPIWVFVGAALAIIIFAGMT
jgi:hypothetical protein